MSHQDSHARFFGIIKDSNIVGTVLYCQCGNGLELLRWGRVKRQASHCNTSWRSERYSHRKRVLWLMNKSDTIQSACQNASRSWHHCRYRLLGRRFVQTIERCCSICSAARDVDLVHHAPMKPGPGSPRVAMLQNVHPCRDRAQSCPGNAAWRMGIERMADKQGQA